MENSQMGIAVFLITQTPLIHKWVWGQKKETVQMNKKMKGVIKDEK